MDYTSTPFISYSDINTEEVDLFEDAWGFLSDFHDVKALLKIKRPVVDDKIIDRLMEKIRNSH